MEPNSPENSSSQAEAILRESDDSLTFSSTPSIPENNENSNRSSISEHISSNASPEMDRSMQEIEVTNFSIILDQHGDNVQDISQELKPSSISLSSNTNFSIISLNALDRFMEPQIDSNSNVNVKSVLEEILQNESKSEDAESLNIFANIELDDKSLNNYKCKNDGNDTNSCGDDINKKSYEDLLSTKDTIINVLTTNVDSLKEIMSNPSSNSLGTSITEYKQLQEECHARVLEYHTALVHKDEIVQKLTESLHLSILNREELKQQIDQYKSEIAQLNVQIAEATEMLQKNCDNKSTNFEDQCAKLEKILDSSQLGLLNDLKISINNHVQNKVETEKKSRDQHIENLQKKLESDRLDYESEIKRLRDLLANIKCGSSELMDLKVELDERHSREMEELRTYFEKKCADLEKNYSEEVFSQHSRRMSMESSTGSDATLPSDFAFPSNPSGPAGDGKSELTKKDIIKMREKLSDVLSLINRYEVNNLTIDDLNDLKSEISALNLNSLLKCDLISIKGEIRNKYHAELEILREDFDTRLDELNLENEKKLRDLELKYKEEIDLVNAQFKAVVPRNLTCNPTVQEVASSGDFEIIEVVKSYERRLQEQVAMAKIDIIAALELQIQHLAVSDNIEEEWPSELLQLKTRFTEIYETKMAEMRRDHENELAQLKEDNLKMLNGALGRARRRSMSLTGEEIDLIKERDAFKKQSASLRSLLDELLKYFTRCEDELNNTLVDELTKYVLDKDSAHARDDSTISDDSNIRRVHLTPNLPEIITMMDDSALTSQSDSFDLQNELSNCLEKLKSEANAILALTAQVNRVSISSFNNQNENNLARRLRDAENLAKSLELEREILENQLDDVVNKQKIIENELVQARNKIAELIENGHKEIVSEGYGEGGISDAVGGLTELQERARNLVAENLKTADPKLLQIVEEFSRVGERIREDSAKEREDLKQQIEAADKKYKITCQFLEEQAAEREQERDEAQKEIDTLRDLLKDREKDRASCERVTSEVEQLEERAREMSQLLTDSEKRCREIEIEKGEAIEKIYDLREIIRNLENQVELKSARIEQLSAIVAELESFAQQSNDELNRQAITNIDDLNIDELRKQIIELEHELQRQRLNCELIGDETVLKQLKYELGELEVSLEKKTKILENLHCSATNCSSPSEDMSIRDVINNAHAPCNNNGGDDCDVPLQQLARLKEKLMRHSRAEDAAIKRIRDFEMQIFTLRSDLDECQNEKDIFKEQIADQMALISSLQVRLDEQRIRAEHIEKQSNSSLESRIYDLQNEVGGLEEELRKREQSVAHFRKAFEETKVRLEERENDLNNSSRENNILVAMQKEIEILRFENNKLKCRIDKESLILPNLVDNIISDKNANIDLLRKKLDDTEKLLQMYTTLNLSKNEIDALNKLRITGLSFLDLVEDDAQVRRAECTNDSSISISQNIAAKMNDPDATLKAYDDSEISRIEKIASPNTISEEASLIQPNSIELSKLKQKRVRFEDTTATLKRVIQEKDEIISENKEQLATLDNLDDMVVLKRELNEKDEMIAQYRERFAQLGDLEKDLITLQNKLTETESELQRLGDVKKIDLVEKKSKLDDFEKELNILRDDSKRKDEMYFALAKEKRDLEKSLHHTDNLKTELEEKCGIIKELEVKSENLRQKLEIETKINCKLQKDLANNKLTIDDLIGEIANLKAELDDRSKRNNEILLDRQCEIEILNEDAARYQEDIAKLEEKLRQISFETKSTEQARTKLEVAKNESDAKITELSNEIAHLQDLLNEKEKIINQMEEDSRSLHKNLETIQDKMQETGNIVDLSARLREEMKKNFDLLEEVHTLKIQLYSSNQNKITAVDSIDEIAGQVGRELDYSAYLDSNLISAVVDIDKNDLPNLESLQKNIDKQKSINKQLMQDKKELELKLADSERINTNLQSDLNGQLDKYKSILNKVQLEDAKLIQQLRVRLDETVDGHAQLERVLKMERAERAKLESAFDLIRAQVAERFEAESAQSELRKNCDDLRDMNAALQSQIRNLKLEQVEGKCDVRHLQEIVDLKSADVEKYENNIVDLKSRLSVLNNDLFKMKKELDDKNKQIDKIKIEMDDMDQDRKHINKQNEKLKSKLKVIGSTKLKEKIQILDRVIQENKEMLSNMSEVLTENANIEERSERQLDDPSGRADYLFAKYLRSESYRRALSWQKNYLVQLLRVYERVGDDGPMFGGVESGDVAFSEIFNSRTSGIPQLPVKQRFRSIVFVVIAISRMQYMVKRWRSGKRFVHDMNARYRHGRDKYAAGFHVGKPVSGRLFNERGGVSSMGAGTSDAGEPWGRGEPTRDGAARVLSARDQFLLSAPRLVSQLNDRLNDLKGTFGVILDSASST